MTAFVWLVDLYLRSAEAQAGTPEEEEIRFCSLQIPRNLYPCWYLVSGPRTYCVFDWGSNLRTDRVAP